MAWELSRDQSAQIKDIALDDPVGSTRRLPNAKQGASLPESSNGENKIAQSLKIITNGKAHWLPGQAP
jgi:hypothetical protein